MDAKYHKAVNVHVVSGCKANPNVDSLMIGETSNIHGGVPNGTPDSYSGPQT